jgi:hypothetical protein
MLRSLRFEISHDHFDFCAAGFLVKRDIKVRLSEIPIIFEYLIFQYQMVAKGIPREIGQHTMILVPVVTKVCKYEVRIALRVKLFESVLNQCPLLGEITLAVFQELYLCDLCPVEKLPSASFRLPSAITCSTEDKPINFDTRFLLNQFDNCATTPDFDVVTMSPNTQNLL